MESQNRADAGGCPNSLHSPDLVPDGPKPASPPLGGLLVAPSGDAGAPPCNTAPANYSPRGIALVLRGGVDSLYLSFPGEISPYWDTRLRLCKEAAAGPFEKDRASAQAALGGHLFEIGAKGAGLFAYVLTDNWFRIAVSSSGSHQLPLCYCRISSEVLTLHGQQEAVKTLSAVVSELGVLASGPKVSRVDLCVDFVPECPMDFENRAWVRRARKIDQYSDGPNYTGCVIGKGGDILARIYDKTVEIKQSGKKYLRELWAAGSWDGMSAVWRLEFQFKRPFLIGMGLSSEAEVTSAYSRLWTYATAEWLRLTEPLHGNENQSRWPTHPLWQLLQAFVWGSGNQALPLKRVKKDRAPSDDDLFTRGLAPITSFMAREGIYDFEEGCKQFIQGVINYHDSEARYFSIGLDAYVEQKVLMKMRRYNTFRVVDSELEERIENTESTAARLYREGKDGE